MRIDFYLLFFYNQPWPIKGNFTDDNQGGTQDAEDSFSGY